MTHFNRYITKTEAVDATQCRPGGSRSNPRSGVATSVIYWATNDKQAVDCPKCRALLAKAVAK